MEQSEVLTQQKVSAEELEVLKRLQEAQEQLTQLYGNLHLEIKKVDRAMDELMDERAKVAKGLEDKFGSTGTVDITTGIFTPDSK